MTSSTFKRAERTAWRTFEDETVVIDLSARRMYGLNDAAGRLWHALDGSRDSRRLAGELGISRPDLEGFCAELVELDLLEASPAAAPPAREARGPSLPEGSPAILWQEPMNQVAGTCAFLPGQNPLCIVAPFS